jgi:phosphinothricin acetyltransferase
VDTSVYLDPKCQRRGVGRGLYVSLFGVLAAQGFFNAYAGIALPNPASVGLHESVGFKAIGVYQRVGYKLGAWHDVGWWHLPLKAHPDWPKKPVDLADVQSRAGWGALLANGEPVIRVVPV